MNYRLNDKNYTNSKLRCIVYSKLRCIVYRLRNDCGLDGYESLYHFGNLILWKSLIMGPSFDRICQSLGIKLCTHQTLKTLCPFFAAETIPPVQSEHMKNNIWVLQQSLYIQHHVHLKLHFIFGFFLQPR